MVVVSVKDIRTISEIIMKHLWDKGHVAIIHHDSGIRYEYLHIRSIKHFN